MKRKITTIDEKETNKRQWSLSYTIVNVRNTDDIKTERSRAVNFRADSHDEALKKSLTILKTTAKKISWGKELWTVILMPGRWHAFAPVQEDELFRLKDKYATKETILKIEEKDLRNCFVQGYGPKEAEQLQET